MNNCPNCQNKLRPCVISIQEHIIEIEKSFIIDEDALKSTEPVACLHCGYVESKLFVAEFDPKQESSTIEVEYLELFEGVF